MKKATSIEFMIMGTCLIPLALAIDYKPAKYILLVASIVLNIIAVVKSFKEKYKKES